MGVTPSGTVEANGRVRARVSAAGKALEGDDRQTDDLSIIVRLRLGIVRLKFRSSKMLACWK